MKKMEVTKAKNVDVESVHIGRPRCVAGNGVTAMVRYGDGALVVQLPRAHVAREAYSDHSKWYIDVAVPEGGIAHRLHDTLTGRFEVLAQATREMRDSIVSKPLGRVGETRMMRLRCPGKDTRVLTSVTRCGVDGSRRAASVWDVRTNDAVVVVACIEFLYVFNNIGGFNWIAREVLCCAG